MQSSQRALSELEHMKFLCKQGFLKAVILYEETWRTRVRCLHFEDVKPQHELRHPCQRIRTPWPAPQPQRPHQPAPFPVFSDLPEATACTLELDTAELEQMLTAPQDYLWTDYSVFDLPDFIRSALDSCQPVDQIDRYVIYTDGSSQTKHRHRPPLWVAERDISDSWAFAVFAEQYADESGRPWKLQFLGLQCQVVLYEDTASHYIGTTKIGSDASETEGLFWSGMWRLAQNNCIPTVFVSDSRLTGDQAMGRIGIADINEPYRNLRAVFQTLAACLPGEDLHVDHVRSHAGDPYNELVDWLAKFAGTSTLCLPRQPIHMPTFRHTLKHLWMAVQHQVDLHQLTCGGLHPSLCRVRGPTCSLKHNQHQCRRPTSC